MVAGPVVVKESGHGLGLANAHVVDDGPELHPFGCRPVCRGTTMAVDGHHLDRPAQPFFGALGVARPGGLWASRSDSGAGLEYYAVA